MAVSSVRLISVEGSIGTGAERRYTKVWEVETDNINDGPITARNAAGIDSRLSTFSFGNDVDVGVNLIELKAKLTKARDHYKMWTVTGQWQSGGSESSDDDVDDPLDRRTRWSGSFVQFVRDFLKDKDDKTIKNSAGDPFLEPPVSGDDSRLSIIATKNFSSLNVNTWAQFRDAVNSATWWGLAARKIKVQSITWDQRFHDDVPYYEVRFEFHINDDTWDVEVLDAGYYEKVGGKRERIETEKFGRDINVPWPLTTAGAAMPTTDVAADGENYKTFKIYNEKDFSLLGLPSVLGAA